MTKYYSPFKAQALVAGSNLAYLTPAETVAHIRALVFHNTTVDSVSIEVYLLPAGIAAIADQYRLVKKTLTQNQSYLCPEVINQALEAGARIMLVGTGVNARLSVAEQAT